MQIEEGIHMEPECNSDNQPVWIRLDDKNGKRGEHGSFGGY